MSNPSERKKTLIKICELYYNKGLSQQEIADLLGISRPQISRMLNTAKAEGIVTITIKNPYQEEQQYESALEKAFGIKDAIVVNTGDLSQAANERLLGDAGADFLELALKDDDIISVMAGKTVRFVCRQTEYFPRKGLKIVPAIGGWGNEGTDWHANSNTKALGENLRSKYFILNAPSIVASMEARDIFLNEPEISSVLNLARQSTFTLMGIGQMSSEATIVQSGVYNKEDVETFKKSGAAASLCSWFIDKDGNCIDYPAKQRLVGLTDSELRKIPNVVAIANGLDKAEAILATLRGKWISVLVTDIQTAKAVLEMQGVPL